MILLHIANKIYCHHGGHCEEFSINCHRVSFFFKKYRRPIKPMSTCEAF
jgi:hypothetical protein